MRMAAALKEERLEPSGGQRIDNKDFVTVVAVDSLEVAKKDAFVTILSIGDEGQSTDSDSEEVLVYRLPGERLGFGLKFDGGSNATEKVVKLMIQSCAADSPASRTTVSWGHFSSGDEILEIDSVPVTEMTRMECVRALKESNVRLKLRVRKGDQQNVRSTSVNRPYKSPPSVPPPVPPRKYPRRVCRNDKVNKTRPPDGIPVAKAREKLNIPVAQIYTDLIAQENSMTSGHHLESESDDTGSSMSTVVDKHFSTPTTSNSSFSDARSITSIEIEPSPSSPNLAISKNRKIDLDRVLEPFLQLEREFSSCATIEHNDLFQKLVEAAHLETNGDVEEVTSVAPPIMLEPPDIFRDSDKCYQEISDDVNNNSLKVCHNKVVPHRESVEEPPKPLPRKEIPGRITTTKYGKKRPPPPPPPPYKERSNRCPTPNRETSSHEYSDSDLSVDRLPRLIDFVPKDRNDVIVPNAVHPNPMDMLLERQRILSIVALESNSAKDETDEGRIVEQTIEGGLKTIDCEEKENRACRSSTIITKQKDNNECNIESQPNELSTHAEYTDKETSLTITASKELEQLCPEASQSVPCSSTNYATLPLAGVDIGNMKPLLAVSTSVSLNLPNSPPAYSRMPPDGHEFPHNYQDIELELNGPSVPAPPPPLSQTTAAASLAAPVNTTSSIITSSNVIKPTAVVTSPLYADSFHTRRNTYTDVFNEAKLLDVERAKMPAKAIPLGKHSQSWRNDERSERSVKDKIAMFSNAIEKSSPSPSPSRLSKCRSEEVADLKPCSKIFSKSVFSVNSVGKTPIASCRNGTTADNGGKTFKSKSAFCDTTNDVNMNRTQSSIDLTLFSSSCSSAYSSCSPDSSLSPMSSPSYTIGSSSTLPRKHKSPGKKVGENNTGGSVASSENKHAALARAISFTGTTPPLHTRSQSFDVLQSNRQDERKNSLTTLIEQRRRTMSKLRGLVIPEKTCADDATKPIVDLPEIKSKEVMNGICSTGSLHASYNGPSSRMGAKNMNFVDCSWKSSSVFNSVDIPKYSPAFKRKSLTVYGVVSSSTSSLSSSLNSSREELRDKEIVKKPAPVKPPRTSYNNQLVYGPTVYKSFFNNKHQTLNDTKKEEQQQQAKMNNDTTTNNNGQHQISRNDIFKLQEDSDNDSAVSSSRSSLCQEYSPPSSPAPNGIGGGSGGGGADYDNANERTLNDSPSRSSSRTLRRTLSSETNVSLTSSVSTLTSGSQASNNSCNNEDAAAAAAAYHREQSKRVLKAESVEAINRKNVLSSAKYSCGQDFKVGSPLIKSVYEEGQRSFSERFDERNWYSSERGDEADDDDDVEDEDEDRRNVKISSYLEMHDGDESDCSSSVKENSNSSSVDTDEALDKSLDSTDSLCGNYLMEETNARCKSGKEGNDDLLHLLRKSRCDGKRDGRRETFVNGEYKKSVSDIKKAFEEDHDAAAVKMTTTATTTTTTNLMKSNTLGANHLRMSSTDSTASDESFPSASAHGLNMNLVKEQQFGSITSLASSTSLISQQELQQLIDEANQTLEETASSGEHDLMVVILHRDTIVSSIGITLAGGADYEAKEITVHKILVGSPADKDGRIQRGDRILSINGRNMKGVTHREALSILKAPRPEVVLVVSRSKTDGSNAATTTTTTTYSSPSTEDPLVATFKNTVRPPRIPETATDCDTKKLPSSIVHNNDACKTVKALKGPITSVTLIKEGGGLGFSLEGGKDSPFGDLPLTIKKIFTGGCAAKSGSLAAGDELISLNGIDVTSMSRTEAWNMMKRLADGQVVLNIRRAATATITTTALVE